LKDYLIEWDAPETPQQSDEAMQAKLAMFGLRRKGDKT